MRTVLFALLAVSLAGCMTENAPPPAVQVTVSGPRFPASAFDCGTEPLPADPAGVGAKGGSAAAHYENSERGWGRSCQRKLHSVGEQLQSAGQVVPAR